MFKRPRYCPSSSFAWYDFRFHVQFLKQAARNSLYDRLEMEPVRNLSSYVSFSIVLSIRFVSFLFVIYRTFFLSQPDIKNWSKQSRNILWLVNVVMGIGTPLELIYDYLENLLFPLSIVLYIFFEIYEVKFICIYFFFWWMF